MGRYPNKFGRLVLSAMEEVVGRNGLLAVLKLGRLDHWTRSIDDDFQLGISFAEMGRLFAALDELYGPKEGQTFASLAGQRVFHEGIRELGFAWSIAEMGRRVLPPMQRSRVALEALQEILQRYSEHQVQLWETERFFYWSSESCGLCYGRRTGYPACGFMEGILTATLTWVNVERHIQVEEVACKAQGDTQCIFRAIKPG